MVYKCCVPNCRGNYDGNGPHVPMFQFPKDGTLRNKWISAIHRHDFVPTANTKVCALHFDEKEIRWTSTCYDEKSGKELQCTLERPRLKEGAIPTKLPGCPAYLSAGPSSSRMDPNERRQKRAQENLRRAIAESLESKSKYDAERALTSFDVLHQCLERDNVGREWTIVNREDCVLLGLVCVLPRPVFTSSVVIKSNFEVSVFSREIELKRLGNNTFPRVISHFNELIDILERLKNFCENKNDYSHSSFSTVNAILSRLITDVDDDVCKQVKFIMEQINLLITEEQCYRYSADLSAFCSILFSISPHAYKFLRRSGYVIFPHPRTIQKMCSVYKNNPQQEQEKENILKYTKEKFKTLKESDRIVSLMIDEIYLKPFLDYKGGNIVGTAYDSRDAATSAHVFMIQSLLSQLKEVVHILPVRNITAKQLFIYLKQIVCGLQDIGFRVICIVSDNHRINRRCMSYFASPPRLSIVYPHPSDASQPLFFIIDSVHILKCVRNNWINKKDPNQTLLYPHFDVNSSEPSPCSATFSAVKELHKIEFENLVKFAYRLSERALSPTSLERQNMKYVLQLFNEFVVQALQCLGAQHNILFYEATANFIDIVCKWWGILNVKTVMKGIRLNNKFQSPITMEHDDEKLMFLQKFLLWLDRWKEMSPKSSGLTSDTHLAITHTTYGLLELSKYCIRELKFKYFLPGKIQTDSLEARFGHYRTMAGSHYLISLRQVFEVETKIRMQNFPPLKLCSSNFGEVNYEISDFQFSVNEVYTELPNLQHGDFDVDYWEEDFERAEPYLPVLTYLSGYCARAALKKINQCADCVKILLINKDITAPNNEHYSLIKNLDRGGLILPQPDVVTVVLYNYITLQKLTSDKYEKQFLACISQREVLKNLTLRIVEENNFFLTDFNCKNGHLAEKILKNIVRSSTNSLLNNYTKKKNDFAPSRKKRKFQTFKQ